MGVGVWVLFGHGCTARCGVGCAVGVVMLGGDDVGRCGRFWGCFRPLIGRVAPCWGCWGVVCIMVFLIVKRLIQRVFSGVFVGVVCNNLEGQKEVILTFVMAIFTLKTYRKPP